MIVASGSAVVLFDSQTVTLDKAMRSFRTAIYLPAPDKDGAVSYTADMQVDCVHRRQMTVAVNAVRADGSSDHRPLCRARHKHVSSTYPK